MSRTWLSVMLFLVAFFSAASLALASPDSEGSYIRLSRDKSGSPIGLDVAVTTFETTRKVGGKYPRKIQVDLVGAVHIADELYYERLNRKFRGYNRVLYELIATRENNIPYPQDDNCEEKSALSKFQIGFGSMLKLRHQLDVVDYTARNFLHADVSPDTLGRALTANAETFDDYFLDVLKESYKKQFADFEKSQVLGLKLMLGILSPSRGRVFRRVMAEQLAEVDQISSLMGPIGSTIIVDRNKRALAVLKMQLRATRHRRFAIFYGAGHMPDMANRLRAEFGMHETGKEWLRAWSLR